MPLTAQPLCFEKHQGGAESHDSGGGAWYSRAVPSHKDADPQRDCLRAPGKKSGRRLRAGTTGTLSPPSYCARQGFRGQGRRRTIGAEDGPEGRRERGAQAKPDQRDGRSQDRGEAMPSESGGGLRAEGDEGTWPANVPWSAVGPLADAVGVARARPSSATAVGHASAGQCIFLQA